MTSKTRTTRKRTTKTGTATTITELPTGLLFFGLGANLGNRGRTLRWALVELARLAPTLRVAGLYRSAPVTATALTDQPDYLNTAAVGALERPTDARALLKRLKQLERQAGREFNGPRDGPRPLDIDILAAGDTTVDLETYPEAGPEHWPGALQIPHPRLVERRFALRPLADLAPDLTVRGRSVLEWLRSLGPDQAVERVPWGAPPPPGVVTQFAADPV